MGQVNYTSISKSIIPYELVAEAMMNPMDYIYFQDDFIGEYPASNTAFGAGIPWTKVDNGTYNVIDSGEKYGALKLEMTTGNSEKPELYGNAIYDVLYGFIFECRLRVVDSPDDTSVDIAWGMIDALVDGAIANKAGCHFHIDGAADGTLTLKVATDDDTNDNDPATTGETLTEDTWYVFSIDARDSQNVKFYKDGVRLNESTTYDMSDMGASTFLQPFFTIYKGANDSPGEIQVDWVRILQVK